MTYEQKIMQSYWDLEDETRQPLRRRWAGFIRARLRVRDYRNAVENNRKVLAEYQSARMFARKAAHFTHAARKKVLDAPALTHARIEIKTARKALKDKEKALAEEQARLKRERSVAESRYEKARARLANAIDRTQKRELEGKK